MTAGHIHVDESRFGRTTVAEAIYGPGKSAEEIVTIAVRLVAARRESGEEAEWPVLATRVDAAQLESIIRAAPPDLPLQHDSQGLILEFAPSHTRTPIGCAAVVSAGTTDRGPAAEAAAVLEAYGAEVARIHDVGVAGIHRLLSPDRLAALGRAQVIVAVAGMEGALPGVVAGLVKAPVIAVPAPVGYGVAEGGRAALTTMLASCAPGLAVVNIGNGFGAAAMAVKILRSGRTS